MTTSTHILHFICIALYFICSKAVEKPPIVHVINNLPTDPRPMDVRCKFTNGKSLGVHELNAGEEYQFSAGEDTVYYCDAQWGNLFGGWHGYEPSRDAGRDTVFWLVKDDGFFLSWDKSSWVKKATWETE